MVRSSGARPTIAFLGAWAGAGLVGMAWPVILQRFWRGIILSLRRLIVNADDFGFTRGVNEGIVRAHREGIVTATTLMADGAAFEHAVELARATPSLDVGVHLVLGEGGRLPRRLPAFVVRAVAWSAGRVEREFVRQVEKVKAAGISPSHLDTHKHVHLLPWVMSAAARVAARFGIGWVRRPVHPRQVRSRGLRTPDHFAGLRLTGRMDRRSLLDALARLRPGLTELMCHPGLCDDELRAAPTRLKQERQVEMEALISPEVRALLRRNGVVLTSYREIGAHPTSSSQRPRSGRHLSGFGLWTLDFGLWTL